MFIVLSTLITPPGMTLNVQGKCYIGGNLTTTKFSCNYPFLNVKGNMTVKENDYLSIPGTFKVIPVKSKFPFIYKGLLTSKVEPLNLNEP